MTPVRSCTSGIAQVRHLLRVCCCPSTTQTPGLFAFQASLRCDTTHFHVKRISVARFPYIHASTADHRKYATMASPLHGRAGVETLANTLEKPQVDKCSYRIIKLPNGLEALLIHDPEGDKAAAAMDVNVGSFSDSPDMPGMAHAVEHLLFMGTEKVCRQEIEQK